MITRAQLDAELDHLESMLPVWRESLRHEAQFWPQFNVLSEEILIRAEPVDREYAGQRIEAMLDKACNRGSQAVASPLP
jgi:hypothetical protein